MKKPLILSLSSLLSLSLIMPMVSCTFLTENDKKIIAYIKTKQDKEYKDSTSEFYKTRYLDDGYFTADNSELYNNYLNSFSRDVFNTKPDSNVSGFESGYNSDLAPYEIRSGVEYAPILEELTQSMSLFFHQSTQIKEYSQYVMNFIDFFSKWKYSSIDGYNIFNVSENLNYNGPKTNNVIIRAMGGPSSTYIEKGGFALLRKFKHKVPIIVLNDSQFSFDPIKVNNDVNPDATANSYLDAFAEMFKIPNDKYINNVDMLNIVNFALAYIDAQRLENLQDDLIAKGKNPYLFGFSQGHTTLALSTIINRDVLEKATKIRADNNSIRNSVGLYKENDPKDYNKRTGGVLSPESEGNSIPGGTGSLSLLFAYSKRMINISQGIMNIYQSIFDKEPDFLNNVQRKMSFSYSDADWNIGDLTPKEIEFFKTNKITLNKSPRKGHNLGFSNLSYFSWLDLDHNEYKDLDGSEWYQEK